MTAETPLVKFIVYALLITSGILGAIIATIMIRYYEVMTNGILGFAVLFFIYKTFLPSKRKNAEKNNDLIFKFPEDIKYFALALLLGLIGNSACIQIIRMIIYFFTGNKSPS